MFLAVPVVEATREASWPREAVRGKATWQSSDGLFLARCPELPRMRKGGNVRYGSHGSYRCRGAGGSDVIDNVWMFYVHRLHERNMTTQGR